MPRGDRGGKKAPARPKAPTRADKQATIWAAEQLLAPWEVRPKKPKPPKKSYTPQKRVTQDDRYKAALAAPVSPAARRFVADTMAPGRRSAVRRSYRPPPPSRDGDGLLDAITATPRSILGHYGQAGRALGRAGAAVGTAAARPVLTRAIETAYGLQGERRTPGPVKIPKSMRAASAGAQEAILSASKLGLGTELTKALTGNEFSPGWAALDAAMLLPVGRPFKTARAIKDAARALPEGREAAVGAFHAAMGGAHTPATLSRARRASHLNVPEREQAHAAVDGMMGADPRAAKRVKDELDAHVYEMSRRLPASQRKQAAAKAYRQVTTNTHGLDEDSIHAVTESLMKHVTPQRSKFGDDPYGFIEQGVRNFARHAGQSLEHAPEAPLWYMLSGRRILEATGGNLPEAEKLLQLIGIYSPQTEVTPNLGLALKAYRQHKAGEPIRVNSLRDDKARAVLESGEDWGGRKTNNFYRDLLHDMWPERYQQLVDAGELDDVTVDRHMYTLFNLGENDTAYYDYIQDATRLLAEHYGLTPREAQAAVWVSRKAEKLMQPSGGKRGLSFEDAWARAKTNYADALARDLYTTRMPFEARPGDPSVLPDYDSWTPLQKEAHLRAKLPAVERYFSEAGIPFTMRSVGRGFWMAEDGLQINPAFAVDLHAGYAYSVAGARAARKAGKAYRPSQAERALYDRIVLGLGHGLNQKAGSWFRPLVTLNKKMNTLAHVSLGREATESEMRALAKAFEGTNVWFSHADDGVYVVWGGANRKLRHRDFESTLDKALAQFEGDTATVNWYNHDSNYLGGIDEGYSQARDGGGLGELAGAADRLRAESDRVDAAFRADPAAAAREFGFGPGLRERVGELLYPEGGVLQRLVHEEEGALRPGEFLRRPGKRAPEPEAKAVAEDVAGADEGFNAWRGRLWDRLKNEGTHVPPTNRLYRAVSDAEFEAAQQAGGFRPLLGSDLYVTRDADRLAGGAYGGKGGGYIIEASDDIPTRAAGSRTMANVDEEVVDEIPLDKVTRVYKWDPERGDHFPITSPGEQLAGKLPGAKSVRGAQEAGYSVEKGKRIQSYEDRYAQAREMGMRGEDAVAYASRALQGEYPKLRYRGFEQFDEDARNALIEEIHDSPKLSTWQKKHASNAIRDAIFKNRVPQRRQIELLEKVFGKEVAEDVAAAAKTSNWRYLYEIGNLPRALQSSFDLSAPFRQALVAGAGHPVMLARNFKPMFQAAKSKGGYERVMGLIEAQPNFDEALEHGLAITDVGKLTEHEERYASEFAEKIPGVSHSQRAYTAFLDKMRIDLYNNLRDDVLEGARAAGKSEEEALRGLTRYVNAATGRGGLAKLAPAGKALNAFLFSPRLLASRLAFLNPYWYAKLPAGARKDALISAFSLVGTGMVVLLSMEQALKAAGVDVSVGRDPRSANFGKLKIGNTRFDIWGGFQPLIRYMAQLITGTYVSSTTGKEMPLGGGKFGATTRLDIIIRFLRSKEAPNASLITDWADTENVVGDKFEWTEQWQRMLPILALDAHELYAQSGGEWPPKAGPTARALGLYGLGMWGVGASTYGPKPAKPSRSSGPYMPGGASGGFIPGGSGGGFVPGSSNGGFVP